MKNKTFKKNKNKFQKGFTLIEMITAIAIFSFVMLIAMGSLLNVLSANRQGQGVQTIINNLSLSMEMMSREIRTGYSYHCGDCSGASCVPVADCISGEEEMAFEPFYGDSSNNTDQVVFKFDNGQIHKSIDSGVDYLPVTSKRLIIEDFKFYVVGTAVGDGNHPKVLITASGYVETGSGDQRSSFDLQTTVSQRRMGI